MSELSPSSRVQSIDILPKKQEWALIYDQRAKEYETYKLLQKMKIRQKQQAFKNSLDGQISGKINTKKMEKQEDKQYYQFIKMKAEEVKQKQLQQKLQRLDKLRHLEEQNKLIHNLNQHRTKQQLSNHNYTFDIGLMSPIDKKKKDDENRKKILDALDRQINLKAEMSLQQKIKNQEVERKNRQYQQQQFINRNIQRKTYKQNQNVYQQFKELAVEKIKKQKELEHLIVDEAAKVKYQQQLKNKEEKKIKKHQLSNQMKETLDQQIQIHNYRKRQDSKINPQQHSYSVIGSMFRDKISPYDKKQYSQFLRRQVEEQNRRKISNNHMSQEQYLINLNQLNKAITGRYSHDKYYDRSLTNIGEREQKANITLNQLNINSQDNDIVKSRIENIKHRKSQNHNAQEKNQII